jgi:hypothetical protein
MTSAADVTPINIKRALSAQLNGSRRVSFMISCSPYLKNEFKKRVDAKSLKDAGCAAWS